MCLIMSVKAKAYEVAAKQIIIKPSDVQILKKDDKLNTMHIQYNDKQEQACMVDSVNEQH
jgi:hypothetical protein